MPTNPILATKVEAPTRQAQLVIRKAELDPRQSFSQSAIDETELQPVKETRIEKAHQSTPVTSLPREVEKPDDLGKNIARSIFDSIFRGVIRYGESLINNPLVRVPYRLGTETARKTSEIAFLNILNQKKAFSLDDLEKGAMRTLEHGPVSLLKAPGLYESAFVRPLAGLGDMTIRFASRFVLSEVNPTSSEALNEKNIFDEFLSRSLFRIIPVNFENPFAGIGMRALEQLGIDLNLHVVKPFSRLFPGSNNFLKNLKNTQKT